MSDEVVASLIGIVPELLLIGLVLVAFLALRAPITQQLIPRLAGVRVGVLEIALQPRQVEAAVQASTAAAPAGPLPAGFGEIVVRRAQRIARELRASSVLWHDPRPENNLRERQLLHDLGVFVEVATTIDDAIAALRATGLRPFDVVISNIGAHEEGRLLRDVMGGQRSPRLIYYIGRLDPARGVPPEAFGITNRADELLHLIMDVVERRPAMPEVTPSA